MTSRRIRLDVGEPVGFVNDRIIEPSLLTDDEVDRLSKACGFDVEPWESGIYRMTRQLVTDTIAQAVQPTSRRVARELLALESELASWSARLDGIGNIREHVDFNMPTSGDPALHAGMYLRLSKHFEVVEKEIVGLRNHAKRVHASLEKNVIGRKAATKLPIEHMEEWPRVLTWGDVSLALPSKPVFDRHYPFASFSVEMLRIASGRVCEAAKELGLAAPPPFLNDALKVAVAPDGSPSWALIQALARIRTKHRQRER